jgi:hypothetical protein
MTVGINVDPNNVGANPPAQRLLAARLDGVRLTARDNPENRQYIDDMLAAGVRVLAIVATGDNGGFVPPHTQVVLQIFNEPDLAGPTAMDPVAYAELFAIYRGTYPAFDCWTAGFASGQPAYYERFLSALTSRFPEVALPSAVAIHPYLQTPAGLRRLAEDYWNLTGAIPVVATEWFHPAGQGLIWPFQDTLNNAESGVCTVWNSFFPWTSSMAPDLGGLVDETQQCLPAGYELISALEGVC